MTPPNPFSSTMPGSFLPALPASLPSYPKHHPFSYQTQQSPSPTLAPTRKRLQQRRPNDSDSDEDVMRNSLYSDTAFRTTLSGSRKRGLADDDADDYHNSKRVETSGEDGRPAAKRRIIDVVGSVARGVWEFCISKTPFYSNGASSGDEEDEFEREVQSHMQDAGVMPGGYGPHPPPITHNYFQPSTPYTTYTPPETLASKPTPTGGLSSRWVMVSPTPTPARPSTATATSTSHSTPSASRPYTAPHPSAPYNPTTYATTATSTTTALATGSRSRASSTPSRRQIVAGGSRAKRPAVVRKHVAASFPAPPASSFTFGSPASGASTRVRRRRGVSMGGSRVEVGEEEDEADESIRRFNEKLKDMIREGREALGSRIEVMYDDDEDLEGF